MSATESLIERLKAQAASRVLRDTTGILRIEDFIEVEAIAELEALRSRCERMERALREQAEELLWSAYASGLEVNGRWWDGGLSDAEWLTRELGLPSGWNDTVIVKQMIPGAAARIAARDGAVDGGGR